MIIRRSTADCHTIRVGTNGEFTRFSSEDIETLFNVVDFKEVFPITAPPIRSCNLYCVALVASPAVRDGFAYHNAVYELTPANFENILARRKPDYLLIESCLYDSERAWPLLPAKKEVYAAWMKMICSCARKHHVPSLFWHTMGQPMLEIFIDGLRHFDFVACAEPKSLEKLESLNINAKLLPWGFSPEQFNPLFNYKKTHILPRLIFNGMSQVLRSKEIRHCIDIFLNSDIAIIDTQVVITPKMIANMEHNIASRFLGVLSQTLVQEIYKRSSALLAIGATPSTQINALQAAACRCPVLHVDDQKEIFMEDFCEYFSSSQSARERYKEICENPVERARSGHLAWRKVHEAHTFAHRMDEIHQWLGLEKRAVPIPKASVITPTMRPDNICHVLAQYEAQTWPNKELIYVFNGPQKDTPALPPRPDIKIVYLPLDHSAGMAMNLGACAASGDYTFRMDDDDLYGNNYLLDRMIYFREFNVLIIGTAKIFYKFKNEDMAFIIGERMQELTTQPIAFLEWSITNIAGATISVAADHAREIGYCEQAYAHADLSFLKRNCLFSPTAASIDMDNFNFCAIRSDPAQHTWRVSRKNLEEQIVFWTNETNIFI